MTQVYTENMMVGEPPMRLYNLPFAHAHIGTKITDVFRLVVHMNLKLDNVCAKAPSAFCAL